MIDSEMTQAVTLSRSLSESHCGHLLPIHLTITRRSNRQSTGDGKNGSDEDIDVNASAQVDPRRPATLNVRHLFRCSRTLR
jgi:hypothetical protein